MDDYALPEKTITKRLEADHIVPMEKIVRMDGFDRLTEKQQLKILNNPENFTGLSRSANASKQDNYFKDYMYYKKRQEREIKVNSKYREEMIRKEERLERVLQKQIDDLLQE